MHNSVREHQIVSEVQVIFSQSFILHLNKVHLSVHSFLFDWLLDQFATEFWHNMLT